MRLREIQSTQAVRVRTTRAMLPDVEPRPFVWQREALQGSGARPEWYAVPEQPEPYDRLHVSDEQPEREEEMPGA